MKISIVIVDDHLIVLDGLQRLLEAQEGWTVVAACRNGAEAVSALEREAVDLLIVDLRMPGMDGVDLIKRVSRHRPLLPIIVLTAELNDHALAETLRYGVRGVVLKEEAAATLVTCIRTTLEQGSYLGQGEVARSIERLRGERGTTLTRRELEISRLAAEGWRTGDIGSKLGISAGTVKIHLHSIYRKLDITTRVELANAVRRWGETEAEPQSAAHGPPRSLA